MKPKSKIPCSAAGDGEMTGLRSHFYRFLISLVLAIAFTLASSGCAGVTAVSLAPPTSARLSTPIPPYVATDQASAIQARATIQAGEAMAYNLALTGTAVSVEVNAESTRVALQLTSSSATEQHFTRQTQSAGELTATAISAAATSSVATQQAAGTNAAGTRQAIGTDVAQAATNTQMAYNYLIQTTATQLAVNELIRQDESQRQSLEFRTWAWRISLVLAFVFVLVLIWKAVPWVLLKFFGFQSWNGKPIIVVPGSRGGIKIVDIARSLGPGVVIDEQGRLLTAGSAPDVDMQNAVTARAQAAELLLSTGGLPAGERRRVMRQAALSITPVNQGVQPPAEISDAQFKVLPPDDNRVGEWLRDVEVRLLEDDDE